jgi:hypothetical protein
MAGTDEIAIYRGEDVTLPFTMDPVENITGWTLLMSVSLASGVVFTQAGAVVSGPAGTFTVALTDTQTELLLASEVYDYDVWRTDAGAERVLARGTLRVLSVARSLT